MKKLTLLIIASSHVFFTIAQTATNDKLIKHNGEIIEAKVTKVDEGVITYKLPNEDVERVIGRMAVKKIDYANRKTENISDEVVIDGKHDWPKVLIVHNEMELIGLKKGEEIYGKTPYWSVSNSSKKNIEEKSAQNLKKAAAGDYNAPFILLTSDHTNLKKGVVFTYN